MRGVRILWLKSYPNIMYKMHSELCIYNNRILLFSSLGRNNGIGFLGFRIDLE